MVASPVARVRAARPGTRLFTPQSGRTTGQDQRDGGPVLSGEENDAPTASAGRLA